MHPELYKSFADLAYCFGAGLLSSLTPCVYPMIPITLSIFGASGDVPRGRAFMLSVAYVLGIALTYTTLGVVCAQTGMLFGSLLGNVWIVSLLALFLLVLGLHSLELFQLPFHIFQSSAQNVGGKGYAGALLMGLASGFVAAPCVGPVLAIILVQASASGSIWWSAAQLFSYSIGLGMIFLVLGTFSGATKYLPRSGSWLVGVKGAIAILVFTVALSLLGSIKPLRQEFDSLALGVAIGCGAIMLLLFGMRRVADYQQPRRLAACLSTALLICAIASASNPAASNVTHLAWIKQPQALTDNSAFAQGKPVIVDLYADWCAACAELDKHTFSDQRVAEELSTGFTAVKVDLTNPDDQTDALSEKYNVVGLPCVLFLDKQGEEIPGSRISGFMTAKEFLAHIRKFNFS